jgi:hypothetical protein
MRMSRNVCLGSLAMLASVTVRVWPFLAFLVAVWLGSSGIASAQNKPPVGLLCDQQFALCTSANCIPDPGNPKVALCTCDVWDGKGMTALTAGVPSCDAIKPSTDANGWRTVYSYFSLTQSYQGKRLMKCPAGRPWAECLNAKCTVDPANPSKATCACETKFQTGEWVTWGGNCNTQSCSNGFLNGTTITEVTPGIEFLMKELDLKKSPVNSCPADAR